MFLERNDTTRKDRDYVYYKIAGERPLTPGMTIHAVSFGIFRTGMGLLTHNHPMHLFLIFGEPHASLT